MFGIEVKDRGIADDGVASGAKTEASRKKRPCTALEKARSMTERAGVGWDGQW